MMSLLENLPVSYAAGLQALLAIYAVAAVAVGLELLKNGLTDAMCSPTYEEFQTRRYKAVCFSILGGVLWWLVVAINIRAWLRKRKARSSVVSKTEKSYRDRSLRDYTEAELREELLSRRTQSIRELQALAICDIDVLLRYTFHDKTLSCDSDVPCSDAQPEGAGCSRCFLLRCQRDTRWSTISLLPIVRIGPASKLVPETPESRKNP